MVDQTTLNQQIKDYLATNPSLADIASAMQTYNVTPAQMAQAVGLPVEEVQTRYKEVAPSVYTAENVNKLADQILSQGTTEKWTGGLPPEKAALYMADELAKSGVTDITQVAKTDQGIINSMTGDKLISGYGERTGGNLWSGSYEGSGNTGFGVNFDDKGNPIFFTQGASSSTLNDDLLKAAALAAVAYGGYSLFAGADAAAAGLGAAETAAAAETVGMGGAGLTTAELAQLDLALGGAGGTAGAESLAAALSTGASVGTLTNLTGGSGVGTLGVTGANGAFLGEGTLSGIAASDAALANTALGGTALGTSTVTGMGGGTGLLAGAGGVTGLTTAGAGLGVNTAFPWTSLASSLYDMDAKNQMADKWQAQMDKVNQGIEGLYAPGSAEYQALWNDMSRKDAAAGRGSQYGVRAVDLAGKIAPIKTNAMVQSLQPMNTMMQNQMQNQYGGLNSLFYNMANTPTVNNAINTGVSSLVNKGIDSLSNWISGG